MKIYYDSKLAKSLLFGSFKTCMFFGVVLTEYTALSEKVKRHEGIHVRQYWECLAASVVLWFLLHVGSALLGGHVSAWWLLFVPTTFYLLYGVEWLISYVYHILRGMHATDGTTQPTTLPPLRWRHTRTKPRPITCPRAVGSRSSNITENSDTS